MARKLELTIPGVGEKVNHLALAVPASWNELTRKQLLACTSYLFSGKNKELVHLELLRIIMPVPKKVFYQLEPWQLWELKALTAFFWKDPKLTKQLLPSLWVGLRLYHGPQDCFWNLQLLEFILVDTYFLKWHKNQDPELLDKMIAVLYRPEKQFLFIRKRLNNYDGDPRQKFNSHFVEDRALRISILHPEVKLAILTWYRSCRAWLEKKFPNVFSGENQGKAKAAGWEPVLRNMAGSKFGDIYKTGTASLLTILQEMDDAIAHAEEMEEKFNSK